ncbi:hypothetical protein HDU87_000755 [Geranomyces variabilis]|uniref:Uncharacterized protein n=1 Tax=Geranomyces variabilis TaxID=109894 RepID=A0AAD5TN95_9FUNG|nr:hypothetical protein HDU87_000755 [Geranomyces variabilis]
MSFASPISKETSLRRPPGPGTICEVEVCVKEETARWRPGFFGPKARCNTHGIYLGRWKKQQRDAQGEDSNTPAPQQQQQQHGMMVRLIDKGVPAGPLGERDGDIYCYGQMFSAAVGEGIRMHYGEVEYRASRLRREAAVPASTKAAAQKKTCGARCDYLFTSDEIDSAAGWGTEWAAAASIGMRRDDRSKVVHDHAGLVSLLRDIHRRLASQIPAGVEGRMPV